MAAHQYACFERIVSFCWAPHPWICAKHFLDAGSSLTQSHLTPMSCSGLKRTHIAEYSSVYPLSTEANIYISHCMSYTNFPVMLKSVSLTDWQNFRSFIVHFIVWTDKFLKINWKWLTCWQRFQHQRLPLKTSIGTTYFFFFSLPFTYCSLSFQICGDNISLAKF